MVVERCGRHHWSNRGRFDCTSARSPRRIEHRLAHAATETQLPGNPSPRTQLPLRTRWYPWAEVTAATWPTTVVAGGCPAVRQGPTLGATTTASSSPKHSEPTRAHCRLLAPRT